MKKILVMSDIHGNLSALNRVFETEKQEIFQYIVLLGDLIDYGPHSNEVLQKIREIPQKKLLVNIWGNHEKAIVDFDDSRFSSERGKKCSAYTRNNLTDESLKFLENNMERTGKKEFMLFGKQCLAVHGSLADTFWKSISHEEKDEGYAKYDIVFSGHSHIPHFFEHFYPADREEYRNKKRTIFINPGSVGQPRNHNSNAHYAVVDMENMDVCMKTVSYNIEQEIRLFPEEIDIFYKERLRLGV